MSRINISGKQSDRQSFAVIGLGKFGSTVARELSMGGAQVLAVDCEEQRVIDMADSVMHVVQMNIKDEKSFATLGVGNMDATIVAITEDLGSSVLAVMQAKNAGSPMVVAKASDEMHGKILEKVGADRIIIPERESGVRIAHSLLSGDFLEFVELSDSLRMVEITPRPDWIGKTLRELKLRNRFNVNVIAVRDNETAPMSMDVDPDRVISEEMSLCMVMDKSLLFTVQMLDG